MGTIVPRFVSRRGGFDPLDFAPAPLGEFVFANELRVHYASCCERVQNNGKRRTGARVMLALKVIAVIVVLILALGTFLRVRKLRRDEMRALSKPVERRLMTPPPSPYAPSKGFRLLDGAGEPLARPTGGAPAT